MGIIIDSSDFTGKYSINKNDNTTRDLDDYIELYEKMFIYQLLGIELGDLFISDIDDETKEPVTDIYVKIFNPLYVKYCSKLHQSKGILELLKGLVYTEFTKEQNFKNNINGNSQNLYESGENVPAYKNGIIVKYNQILETYNSIQIYCKQNKTDYSLFDGECKGFMSPI